MSSPATPLCICGHPLRLINDARAECTRDACLCAWVYVDGFGWKRHVHDARLFGGIARALFGGEHIETEVPE